MAELTYIVHEQFCQCVALGVFSPSQCYEATGMKIADFKQDPEYAFQLVKAPKIQARIRELEIENAKAS